MRRRSRRPGLSLLEVLIAMTIFLLSLAALVHLVSMANASAYEAKHRSVAAHLARSKMAEVRIGALPLESVGETPLEDDPDFQWQMDVAGAPADGLHLVHIRVFRERSNGHRIEAVLSEYVIDPTMIGSTLDVAPPTSESTPDSAGDATGSGSSGGTGGGMGGGSGKGGGDGGGGGKSTRGKSVGPGGPGGGPRGPIGPGPTPM
jgi:general secretion pathway protein I